MGWARVDEAALVHRVMRAAFAEYAGVLNPPSGAQAETAEDVAAVMAGGGAVVARLDDETVGCARYLRKSDRLYVERVSVLPAYRGRGIASQMMLFIERQAPAMGYSLLEVGVRQSLPQNVALYQKLGYQITSIEPHPRGPDHTLWLVKQLPAGVDEP